MYAEPASRFVPPFNVTLTVAPVVWPFAASKLEVSTLNSCTAPAGGTNATRRPFAMFGDPSSVNSLPPVEPSAVMLDVPALSNGRENLRSPVNATPGTSRASTNGLPSESGIIWIRFSSITCPVDAVIVSSSGDSAVTETVSAIWPMSSTSGSDSLSATRTSIPWRTSFLNPDSSADTV